MTVEQGSVQYRIALGKRDEVVVGPAEAELVITIAKADCGLDPTLAFMRGKLKSSGSTGRLFELLESGAVAAVLAPHA